MGKIKYTEENWKVSADGKAIFSQTPNGFDDYIIAEVRPNSDTEANAKLIAAAPELLEASIELNKNLDDFWNGNRGDLKIRLINEWQQHLKAAIKKATK